MSENNDYIQLPPLKKDTPADVVAFMWEYMKVPENSREKVKNLLKDANENGVKLSHQAPTPYDVVPQEEIPEFEELMRKTIADIVSEASSIACCNDGTRPVIFKIERIDIPENEEEKQWLKKQNFKNTAEDAYTG